MASQGWTLEPAAAAAPSHGWSLEEATPASGPGVGEALLRGGAQGVTAGFGDELAAAAGAALTDNSNKPTFGERYQELRDSFRRDNAAAAEAHPVAFTAGSVAGGAPLAIATGGGIGANAALGAANGLGSSNADLTKGDVAGALEDTVKGAALGAGAAGVGKVLARAPAVAGAAASVAKDLPLATILKPTSTELSAAAGTAATGVAMGHPHAGLAGAATALLAGVGKRAKDAAQALGVTSKITKAAIATPGKFGAYGPLLTAAFARGGQQELDAHLYTLGQTDPKFQDLSRSLAEEKDGN